LAFIKGWGRDISIGHPTGEDTLDNRNWATDIYSPKLPLNYNQLAMRLPRGKQKNDGNLG
jgi:hypothetical protein